MKGLEQKSSPCVCGRNFSWRRILEPNTEKADPRNWLVCFGRGLEDEHWRTWCGGVLLFTGPDRGVLLVTAETPEEQWQSELYQKFDCARVRTLSDVQCRVGESFGVKAEAGSYQNDMLMVFDGKVEERFRFGPQLKRSTSAAAWLRMLGLG